jgi:ADP-ribose pyrophosphatase YjhB (NUDIX family)
VQIPDQKAPKESNVKHRTPGAGVSVALFRERHVLLIERGKPPYKGFWSLPGGSVEWGEPVEAAARRELLEETGLQAGALIQCAVVDGMTRDDDGAVTAHFVITVFCGVDFDGEARAQADARQARWVPIDDIQGLTVTPKLEEIVRATFARLSEGRSE